MMNNVAYYVSRETFAFLIKLLFKYNVSGNNNFPTPPFIVAANHASLVDPPLVGMACSRYPIDFMAKKELFDTPIVGIWTRSVGCIEVRRGESGIKSIKEVLSRIKRGRVVGVFPEGTRSADGNLQEAKRGIGFLIAKAAVPVVPVYIRGSGEAFPKGGGIKPGMRIDVFVGKPIFPSSFLSCLDVDQKNYEAISIMVMDEIKKLKEQNIRY